MWRQLVTGDFPFSEAEDLHRSPAIPHKPHIVEKSDKRRQTPCRETPIVAYCSSLVKRFLKRMAGKDFCDYCLHNSEEFVQPKGRDDARGYSHIESAQDPPLQSISQIRYFQNSYKKAFSIHCSGLFRCIA